MPGVHIYLGYVGLLIFPTPGVGWWSYTPCVGARSLLVTITLASTLEILHVFLHRRIFAGLGEA